MRNRPDPVVLEVESPLRCERAQLALRAVLFVLAPAVVGVLAYPPFRPERGPGAR